MSILCCLRFVGLNRTTFENRNKAYIKLQLYSFFPWLSRNEAIGVTTGRAFCGVVGHRDRHEYTGKESRKQTNKHTNMRPNYGNILSTLKHYKQMSSN